MSKRCPDCGFVNEDSRIYCGSCGEPLDAELRLMKELNVQSSGGRQKTHTEPSSRQDPESRASRSSYDDDVHQKLARKKESSPVPLIILGLVVAAVIAALIFLS